MPAPPPPRAIRIEGARTHNLKDLTLALPRDALTVVCGVSGSGKSSLVLDTLGAESRRRWLGTLARRGAEEIPRPDVDRIEGLPPAVVAGFRAAAPGRRHTLGTLTETTHALRTLYARAGEPQCPTCRRPLGVRTREGILSDLLAAPPDTRVVLLAPRGAGPGAWEAARRAGFVRARVGAGAIERLEEREAATVPPDAALEVVVDRLVVRAGARERFASSVDQALALGEGRVRALLEAPGAAPCERAWSDRPWCAACGRAWPRLGPAQLSPTSPHGACPRCEGLGVEPPRRRATRRAPAPDEDPRPCRACGGARLAPYGASVRLEGHTLPEVEAWPLAEAARWLEALRPGGLAAPAREEALARLAFLREVGMGHLALGRGADTLSAGELARARLATACAARMSGLLYLLDEPTAGLGAPERALLVERLRALVAEGNTVVCVEHDLDLLERADHIVELGPGPGERGGRIVAAGTLADLRATPGSPTAEALARPPPAPRTTPRPAAAHIAVRGARRHGLGPLDFAVPVPGLTVVTGPSGAGKTVLLRDLLGYGVRRALEGRPVPRARVGALTGAAAVERVVLAEARAPRHPRATAAGVLGALAPLRAVYAQTLEARARGLGPAWFSPHRPGGRCEDCQGTGERTVTLRDLPTHRIPCETCQGTRFHPEAARVRVKGLSIADVLALTVEEAAGVFRDLPRVAAPLRAARETGLGHLRLGESPARVSGGEALRLTLAAALAKGRRTRTLYLLDEPAAGLHPQDAEHLAALLVRLGARHAVVAVAQHARFVNRADHRIAL